VHESRDLAALRAEVSELRAELGTIRTEHRRRDWRGFTRLRRSASVFGLVAILIALPVAVSASHSFTDVPDSNTFHANIGNLYGARITTGCSPTTYCPNDPVTRGSMAAFLNRGLGRAAGDAAEVFNDDWATLDGAVGNAILRTGGVAGGTAHVLVEADLSAWTNEAGICPCEIEAFLSNSATPETSIATYASVVDQAQLSGYRNALTSVSHLFTVPSGINVTYSLNVTVFPTLTPSPENDAGYAYSVSAVYLPFDSQGENPGTLSTSGHEGKR
jgi:hypothetical protein